MHVNPIILAILAVVLVVLVIFIVIRNKRDKDEFVEELNAEDSRPPSNKEDLE